MTSVAAVPVVEGALEETAKRPSTHLAEGLSRSGPHGQDLPPTETCPLCESSDLAPAYETLDRDNRPVSLRTCVQCTVVVPAYARPASTEESTAIQVRLHEHEWEEETAQNVGELIEGCKSIIDVLKEYVGEPTDGHLVCEFGAGRGGLLGALKQRGYRIIGCEPSPVLCELARRYVGLTPDELKTLPVHGMLDEIEAKGLEVQTFFMWHVLEHFADPWDVLRRIAKIAKPGTHVLAQCPLVSQSCIFAEHYFLLTEVALLGLADSSGFEVVRLDYDHERAFVGFVLRRKEGPVPERVWRTPTRLADAADTSTLHGEEQRRLRLQLEGERYVREGAQQELARLLEQNTHLRRQLSESKDELTHRNETLASLRATLEEVQTELETALRRASTAQSREFELEQALQERMKELESVQSVLRLLQHEEASSRWRERQVDPIGTLISHHLTHRLYQRWKHLRGHNVSLLAPSIGDRLLILLGRKLPTKLASGIDATRLEAEAFRAATNLKSVAKKGGRLAKKAFHVARRFR